ncbi:hypothetical protein BDP27DRAFT_1309999 [Rhodocollybia butyracea]|uniref:Pinin/SDK/MemA protein domain-containing protein n=1 Tax=Rhodocollybia butyracea TaxID=206335 RepID=A0A9P5UH62_9AGAR|nr:hypothetical protein BDP27DRAFT_1309999 [Rhodocollybia butyracea]
MSEEATASVSPSTNVPPRPRLNRGERGSRGGKSMFGLVLGTLNKAKIEGKERDASEAAKRRQMLEARLQAKLRNETAEVRRQEEAKKDKTLATRKEEELGVKVSVYKLRRTRLPLLANFLLTSDDVSDEPSMDDPEPPVQDDPTSHTKILSKANPPRSHPPPLYYLPKILLPSQETFLKKRKEEIISASAAEWSAFTAERDAGVKEILQLREKVASVHASAPEKDSRPTDNSGDVEMDVERDANGNGAPKDTLESQHAPTASEDKEEGAGAMDVDSKVTQPENEGDDAVEY